MTRRRRTSHNLGFLLYWLQNIYSTFCWLINNSSSRRNTDKQNNISSTLVTILGLCSGLKGSQNTSTAESPYPLAVILKLHSMLNSAEEHSFWFLRLNGFFLLDNFVIHKSSKVDYSSDTDILGIRTSFVFEEIGGQEKDWDNVLFQDLKKDSHTIGIICQVKGGDIGDKKLFREPYLSYSIQRLGLTQNIDPVIEQLQNSSIATFTNELGINCQIMKLLITRDEPKKDINYVWLTLDHIYKFIIGRIQSYPEHKYRDRNFFSSIGFQTLIELNQLYKKVGQNNS